MKSLPIAAVLSLCLCISSCARDGRTGLYRGELEASKVLIASPREWNKKLLILAHGLMGEQAALRAAFPHDSTFYRTLLEEGWIIGTTSYRRKGASIDETIEDLGYLREFVVAKYGNPDRVYVKGAAMGGAIALRIAESFPDGVDGVLCECPPIPGDPGITHRPKVPLVFLTNHDETFPVRAYMANLRDDAVKPVFWVVEREGRCNMNGDETLAAFRQVIAYSEKRPVQFARKFVIDKEERDSVAIFMSGRAYARVNGFSTAYGNIYTDFVRSDLERLGVAKGDIFTVGFGEKAFPVTLGSGYGDVPRGDWVAFFDANADNLLKIARNHANAAEELGCGKGDMIFLER